MENYFTSFGLRYDAVSLERAVEKIEDFIHKRKPCAIYTTGAELVVRADRDKRLRDIYLSGGLVTVDSYNVYFACRLLGKKLPEPVSAAKLMFAFLKRAADKGYRVYFLGAKPEVLEQAMQNLKLHYPGVKLAGFHHGFFDFERAEKVIDGIRQSNADIIFVAMSSPLKEKFISSNLVKMNIPVAVGVGGSVDVLAGQCKLAPKFISRLGLEWCYRLAQEPCRLWRRYLVTNTLFLGIVLKEFLNRNEKNRLSKSAA